MKMETFKTDEARFVDLPDFTTRAQGFRLRNGLEMAYLDSNPESSETVLLLHGEPTWSFLYRRMIPTLAEAGLRVVAPDLIGFGRSDKPGEGATHTYAAHVGWLREFVSGLNLSSITLFCQDWGGLLGLRVLAANPERFSRVVASNTYLLTGDNDTPEAFLEWRRFSQRSRTFRVGRIVRMGCARPLAPGVVDAYEAPFPTEAHKAGPRTMPLLVPTNKDDEQGHLNAQAWDFLKTWDRPFLTVYADRDPITHGYEKVFIENVPGARGMPHKIIPNAGHFIQEDAGEELARIVRDFIAEY